MDYGKYFSADVPSFLKSPVREIFSRISHWVCIASSREYAVGTDGLRVL